MSLLKQANKELKNGNYEEAYRIYFNLKKKKGYDFLSFNMELCQKRINKDKLVVDIIIPVYNALEDVKNCINSLYEHKTHDFNIIVIDDCSDKDTEEYLQQESKNKGFKLLRNKENLRFTKTVNRGFQESHGDYVVLLNSDTIVTPRWIEKILACFKSDEKIGIVGTLSNAASWQTVPVRDDKKFGGWLVNEIPEGYSVVEMGMLVETISKKIYPKVPSVNGFCYVIKREVLDQNGTLDEEYFPTGYGEEDDFSIRAIDAGFKIAVADDTYIFHAKSKSYTHEIRQILSVKGRAALDAKHGEARLTELVKNWKAEPTLPMIAKHIQSYMQLATKNKKVVYTAIFGNYDSIKEPEYINKDWDYVCFTNNKNLKSDIFTVKYVDAIFDNQTKNPRMLKILSHIFLIGYDYTLWIDGSVKLRGTNIENLINQHKDSYIALHKHEVRECVYDEAQACINAKKDDQNKIEKQITRYKDEGLPLNTPVAETAEILRNQNNKNTKQLNISWWAELNKNSVRDQISFVYVCWKYKFKYSIMDGIQWIDPYFSMYTHGKEIIPNKNIDSEVAIVLEVKHDILNLDLLIKNLVSLTNHIKYKIYILDKCNNQDMSKNLNAISSKYRHVVVKKAVASGNDLISLNEFVKSLNEKYVCFVKTDSYVIESNWLFMLVNELIRHKQTVIVGGTVLDKNNNLISTGIENIELINKKVKYNIRKVRTGQSIIDSLDEQCILINREVFLDLGAFPIMENYQDAIVNFSLNAKKLKYESRFVVFCQVVKLLKNDYEEYDKKFEKPKKSEYKIKIEKCTVNGCIGWIVDVNNKSKIADLDVFIADKKYASIRADIARNDLKKHGLSSGKGGFNVVFSPGIFNAGKSQIKFVLPNGEVHRHEINIKEEDLFKLNEIAIPSEKPVTIIVPIYNAADDLKICIERLLKYTTTQANLLFIDDASPDENISKILHNLDKSPNIRVLKNKKNLGFTKTVNRGIKEAYTDDVVLLNSDARVTPKWLEGMKIAVNSNPKVGTATAMSDRAGAFSGPNLGNDNDLPDGVSEIEFAVAFKKNAYGLYPEVPTGNGFCLYIKRDVINEVGYLDEEAFPRGYGEENDFCMRAKQFGWINIIDDTTYVFHDRNKSFGEQKDDLIQSGRAVVDKRYPNYSKEIQIFKTSDKIKFARSIALKAQKECISQPTILPRALFVVSTQTGGTPQTNKDLMSVLNSEYETWVFRCNSKEMFLSVYSNEKFEEKLYYKLKEPIEALSHVSFEYDEVINSWLNRFNFDLVHIRHLGWHSLSLPKIAKEAGSAVIYSFHDFYSLCPSIKLLDNNSNYCNGQCTSSEGDCKVELWQHDFPTLKNKWIYKWRENFSNALSYCDSFITTSPSSKETILSIYPQIADENFHVIPHGRDLVFSSHKVNNSKSQIFNILIPGNINHAKGMDVIKSLLNEDIDKKLHFHILGESFNGIEHPQMTYHGKYKREDFSTIVTKMDLDVGAVFSIWNETWCHTLTELWSVGLPVMVFDFKTIAGRVKESGAGWVYKHNDISSLYTEIINTLSNELDLKNKYNAVENWQKNKGILHTNYYMASSYLKVYTQAKNIASNQQTVFIDNTSVNRNNIKVAVVSIMHNLNDAPGSTHVRVWERTKNNLEREIVYVKLTPKQLIIAVKEEEISDAIIQRNVLSESEWNELKPYIKNGKLKYILDIDDDLLSVPKDKDTNNKYASYSNTMREVITLATTVFVSTKELRNRYHSINSQCILVENKLSGRLWKGNIKKQNKEIFKLLYVGTPSHYEDFKLVEPALIQIAHNFPNFKLKIIGVLSQQKVANYDWIEVIDVPKERENYPSFVQWIKEQVSDISCGIAPLATSDFNNTKSNLKVLEYAGLGLPVIASKGKVYSEIGKEAPFVITVDNTQDEWVNAITDKILNVEKLEEEGNIMRKWVLDNKTFFNDKEYDLLVKTSLTKGDS
jgi:GT2 family glycosyltransferase/glycosyltransferase involved in cell wall biosynthesis